MITSHTMYDMRTTIKLESETRDELKTCGIKGESYDSILQRLIKEKKNETL